MRRLVRQRLRIPEALTSPDRRSFHSIDLSAPAHANHEWVIYSLPQDAERIVQSAYSQVQDLWARKAERDASPNEQSYWDERWLALTDNEVAE
jgi:hypothetical protein